MSVATVGYYRPVARMANLDRLAALPSRPAVALDLWTEVHKEVQEQLALLEAEVRGKIVGVRVDAGRTKGESFLLCSYRTFSVPNSALDPVVAGTTFVPGQQGVTVEADISGEQTGDWILSVPSQTLAIFRSILHRQH